METVAERTGYDDLDSLIEATRGPRARILEAIRFYGGRADSQKIRNYGRVPSGRYHFKKLEEQTVIERDGSHYVGKGGQATIYSLTDFGETLADEIVTPATLEVDMLPDDVKETFNQMASMVEGNRKRLKDLEHRFEIGAHTEGERNG